MIPGSSLPSRNSRRPRRRWKCGRRLQSCPASPGRRQNLRPPTTEKALLSARALATASVPRAKASNSKTPMGPFHTTVAAPAMALANSCLASGPDIQGHPAPSGTPPGSDDLPGGIGGKGVGGHHVGGQQQGYSLSPAWASTSGPNRTCLPPPWKRPCYIPGQPGRCWPYPRR